MNLFEIKNKYLTFNEQLGQLKGVVDLEKLKREVLKLQKDTVDPKLWENSNKARNVMKTLDRKKKIIEEYENLQLSIQSGLEMINFLNDEFDEETMADLEKEFTILERKFNHFKIKATFTKENDEKNAIMTIKPGAGGTEATDWAMMLLRMYTHWAEKKGFKAETLEFQPGDEAGIKVATINISGDYVYGLLKGETGIHRLVRISPFDSNSRRHTSFASVYVIPEVDETVEVDINPKDLKTDTFHASGPGGQGVNTTDSAVRITHVPTGIFATCQVERSQIKNKNMAMRLLRSRLYEHFKREKEKELEKTKAEKKDISWGHQIRSYVFQPYTMIKDLRTSIETGNIDAVMNGDIDLFIEGYLMQGDK